MQASAGADGEATGNPTLIGRWSGWAFTSQPSLVAPSASHATPRPLWEFTGGEPCWLGAEGQVERTARVELRCAAETELAAVDEDGKCSYWLLLRTPAACDLVYDAEVAAAEADRQAAAAAEAADAAADAAGEAEGAGEEGEEGEGAG